MFQLIDLETWARREYFQHYFHEVPCFYSMTVKLDITRLRQSGERLYPALLYLLSTLVNRHEEFRMALDGKAAWAFTIRCTPAIRFFTRIVRPFPTFGPNTVRHIRNFAPPLKRTWRLTASGPVFWASPIPPATPFRCPCFPGPPSRAST